jgi:hypothetical protein
VGVRASERTNETLSAAINQFWEVLQTFLVFFLFTRCAAAGSKPNTPLASRARSIAALCFSQPLSVIEDG